MCTRLELHQYLISAYHVALDNVVIIRLPAAFSHFVTLVNATYSILRCTRLEDVVL